MRLLVLAFLVVAGVACLAQPPDVPPPLHPKEVSVAGDDPGPGVEVDYQTGTVTRRDSSRKVLWTANLAGNLIGHRDPHVVHDAERIYLGHDDGITALDVKAGKIAWHAKGPNDRLHVSGRLLLAAECTSDEALRTRGRQLIARAVDTGAEVFKVALPAGDFDPWPIREVAGLFLVQSGDRVGTRGSALLVDRKGAVRHRFDTQVLDGRRSGDDRVFLTVGGIVRVTADEKQVWSIPFDRGDQLDGGGLQDVGGDLLCFRFGGIHDSGVKVIRFDPQTGKTLWKSTCAPLGVDHSKYRHRATVAVEGSQVRVTSRGSFGSFVEVLDLETGKQVSRAKRKG
jgi:outer membrane protein assembly factor BamB